MANVVLEMRPCFGPLFFMVINDAYEWGVLLQCNPNIFVKFIYFIYRYIAFSIINLAEGRLACLAFKIMRVVSLIILAFFEYFASIIDCQHSFFLHI